MNLQLKMVNKALDQFTLCLGFFENGLFNCAQISRETGVNERTVRRYKLAYQNKKPIEQIGRNGRPRKVDHPCKISIAQIVRHRPQLSSQNIAKQVELNTEITIRERTVRKTLSNMSYSRKKPRNVPMLSKKHLMMRLKFAQQNLNRDWTKVLFSDESFVQLFSNNISYWTKKGGVRENPQVKDRTKVMFWGAFSINKISKLEFIDGIMTGKVYKGILEKHVIPALQGSNRGSRTRKNGLIFQQDNDPKHTCKLVKEYLKEAGVEVLEWPSCSPDLNPIENLWSIIKRKVYLRFPKNKSQLKEYLIEEWENIKPKTLVNLVESMKKRCQLIIKNNGKRISY